MSALNNSPLLGASGSQGYFLQRSVRLRSSASATFSRTIPTASNRKTWTWSGWVKFGNLVSNTLFSTSTGAALYQSMFAGLTSGSALQFYSDIGAANTFNLVTTQVFRDPSAWYHLVIAFDTTQATASNRAKIYINGVQVTAFSTSTYPTQNIDYDINNNVRPFVIGASNSAGYLDGYLTEVNFIDGQALTPTSFGAYNSTTGVWQPIKYSGTYGTNGFYLNFNDNSAATAAAIGKDSSGNGNNWTPNNISVTAGVTYDSMTDVPTLTSATTANYAVMNPLIPSASSFITSGNLNIAGLGVTNQVQSTFAVTSGKWYWEIELTNDGAYAIVGVSSQTDLTSPYYPGSSGASYGYDGLTGNKYNNTSASAYGATYASGNLISVALDMDSGKIWFAKNGVWQASGDPAAGTNAAFTTLSNAVSTVASYGRRSATAANPSGSFNFGQRPFSYTPPTGFKALNTYNLPTPTIANGATQFAATLYTGNGATQSITNTVNGKSFQPDLVWTKPRESATSHSLYDSIRGIYNAIASDTTAAESNYSPYGVTAFNSNGFTLNDIANGGYRVNGSPGGAFSGASAAYVAWNWKESASSGFDIVQQTLATTGINTINHNLNVVPKMVIAKATNVVEQWLVYQSSVTTQSQYLGLNTDAAVATSANLWGSSAFTSSQIYFTGTSGRNYVYYIFSEISGYSKFGSYIGNGSVDGTFVYLGFRPRFVMVKGSSFVSNWFVIDTSRNPYNVSLNTLRPNLSGAEVTSPTTTYSIDILSNGFKLRTNAADSNTNGATFMYAAFAENPFNYSLAR